MTIATIRRLAADIMNVGQSRVKFNPLRIKEVDKALTRYDVRNLIKAGVVTKDPVKGRRKNEKKKKQGQGSRKGAAKARRGDKDVWMAKVRAQRGLLIQLLEEGVLDPSLKRTLYGRVKAGLFRSKRAFILYLIDGGHLAKDYEYVKRIPAKIAKKIAEKKLVETKKPIETKDQKKEVDKQ